MKKVVAVAALAVALGASFFVGRLTVNPGYTGETDITDIVFLEVFEELMLDHYSQPSEQQLYEGAIQGLLDSLGDPNTTYFDAEAYQEYQSNFGESYVGIGVHVLIRGNVIVIDEVFEDGPADNAGIRPNDIISSVDGIDVSNNDIYETLSMIVGDIGTDVTIGITRAGFDYEIQLVMTRDLIENSSVKYQTFEYGGSSLGYISVRQFGDQTAFKFREAIDALELAGIDGLVVDMRNNGGGHLSAVLSMLREFLIINGRPMFTTEYYTDGTLYRDDYYATRNAFRDYNIVTLVNGGSASASEVFASAMQEHGDYPLLGTLTYGKGTMQVDRVLQSTEDDRLHLSIGRWLTSDGNWVHFNGGSDGITPDEVVEPSVYEEAYKMFLFDDETFQYDQVDSRIINLQQILGAMGYDVRLDGYFDWQTRAAIVDIQQANGLTPNGVVDNALLGILNEALDVYQDDVMNDTQLQAALQYLVDNPDHE